MPPRPDFRSFDSYTDTDEPAQSRDPFASRTDLQDYYDANNPLPAPHHLSGTGVSYPPSAQGRSQEVLPLRAGPTYRDRSPYADRSPFADPNSSAIDLEPQVDPSYNHLPLQHARSMNTADMYPTFAKEPNAYDRYGGQSGRSEWLEKHESGKKRRKMIMIFAIVAVVGLVIAGIVIGVLVSRKSSSTSSSNAGSGSSGGSTAQGTLPGSAGVVQFTNPDDPSTYINDTRLHNSFYGFAYEPLNVQLPWCGAVQNNVTEDMILLSQLTTRIRLYGADCNESALVLEGIQQSKVNMGVFLAIYVTDNVTDYDVQKQDILSALQTYGATNVLGVAVGNEFILNNLTALNENDPNSTAGIEAADYLISLMSDTRTAIQSLNLGKTIPVGTADAGSMFTPHLLQGADFGMANVHPWFGDVAIDAAAGWTYNFFETFDVSPSLATTNKPQMSIAETGWPTDSLSAADETDGPSNASVQNLQLYLDTFVCASNTNGTNYFFFEYFDEPWKAVEFGGVEGFWGVFDSNKNLKNVTIPNCAHS